MIWVAVSALILAVSLPGAVHATLATCDVDDHLGSILAGQTIYGDTSGTNLLSGSCGGGGSPESVYSYTAPVGGQYTFDTFGTAFDTVLYLFDADCFAELPSACNDDVGGDLNRQSEVSIDLFAGDTVLIVVDGYNAENSGQFVLHISGPVCPDPPGLTSGLDVSASGNTTGAEDHLRGSCGGYASDDHSYAFVPPVSGSYSMSTAGSSFETVLYVRDFSFDCTGGELACAPEGVGLLGGEGAAPVTASLNVGLEAGQRVMITVDGNGPLASGAYQLHILGPECPQGVSLSDHPLPFSTSVYSTAGEPHRLIPDCVPAVISPDAIYSLSPPATGVYTIDTIGSSFDTVLYVRDGYDCVAPDLACNDDLGGGSKQSRVEVALVAGERVYIVVDAADGASGPYTLNIAPPSCPTPTDLGSVYPTTVTGSTVGLPNQLATACVGGSTSPDRSFRFTAPVAGTYTFDTIGSDFDTVLSVRESSCVGREIGCDNNIAPGNKQSLVSLPLGAGEEVVVVLDGNQQTGNFALNIDGPPSATLTATATATATLTASPTRTPTRTPTSTATATRTPTATSSASPTSTFTRTPTSTRTPTHTTTVTATHSATRSPTATPSGTATRTYTGTRTASATRTATPGATSTRTATSLRTLTATASTTASMTRTATLASTATETVSPSRTATTPPPSTGTRTVAPGATPSHTPLPTATATVTHSAAPLPTHTPTANPTASVTSAPSRTVTASPPRTATATSPPAVTASATVSPTETVADTPSATPSSIATATATGAVASTETPSASPTVEPAATATATGTPGPEPCTGDCDGLGSVTISELVTAVNIALGSADLEQCPAIDSRADGQATVDELVVAVRHALEGCPAAMALLRAAHL